MNRPRSFGFLFTFVIAAPSIAIAAMPEESEPTPDLPAQLLVDMVDSTDEDDERAIESILGGLDLRLNSTHAKDERFFIADVRPEDLRSYIEALARDSRVEHVEPNYTYRVLMVPDDPMFAEQWSMTMVGAPEAWDISTGKGAVVAVIDTGVAYADRKDFRRVEDLAGTGFAEGYDFVNDTETPNDDHGHGTHVAGTIAQTTNNRLGVAGLAHSAKIMPVKVLDRYGRGTAADISDAIRWAADNGANVINMSLGGGLPSLTMAAAVAYARAKGVVVVCAAGNGSRGKVEYPAAYPGAFAVSAVGPDKQLAYYSSWGKQLAISAPGGDKSKGGEKGGILQNTITPGAYGSIDKYLSFQGTSMATPHVAAAAALVYATGVTDVSKIEKILRSTATDVGDKGWDEKYGDGILNAAKAVESAKGQSRGPAHLVAGLIGLALFALRTAKRRSFQIGALGVVGAILGSSGLFFLDWLGSSTIAGFATHPIASWDLLLFGPSWYHSAIWASAIPMMALATAFLGAKKWMGLIVGLAVGWAAHLAISAVLMPANVLFVPGDGGVLDRLWLIVNAGVLLGLARLLTLARR
jgi:serine protease